MRYALRQLLNISLCALLLTTLLTMVACNGGDSAPPAPELIALTVAPDGQIDPVGATRQFTTTATYDDSTIADVTAQVAWSSSDTVVATIDASGLAAAVGGSFTTITASYRGLSAPVQYGVEYPSEGSLAGPQPIALGTYLGQVGRGTSHFVVSNLTEGGTYQVFLSALDDDADLVMYDSDSSLDNPDCTFPQGRIADEFCWIASFAGPDLHIVVDGADTVLGTTFELSVNQPVFVLVQGCGAEGHYDLDYTDYAEFIPHPLRTGSFLTGQVATGLSIYPMPAVNTRSHRVALSGLATEVHLYVYADAARTILLASDTTADVLATRAVDATPTGDALYVVADGSSGGNSCFTVSALAAEGSEAAPMAILLDRPTRGVLDSTASYYRTTVTAGTNYSVAVTDRISTPNIALSIYDSTGFTGQPLCTYTTNPDTTPCPDGVTPTGNTLNIKIEGGASQIGGLVEILLNLPLPPPLLPDPGP
jgi:hypothetical protein